MAFAGTWTKEEAESLGSDAVECHACRSDSLVSAINISQGPHMEANTWQLLLGLINKRNMLWCKAVIIAQDLWPDIQS